MKSHWIRSDEPALILAPMEGVTDLPMRTFQSERSGERGFTHCVTEFLRVSGTLLPNRVFLEHCPELRADSRTPSGAPVSLQLLGGDATLLAENAARAVELGARAIDLNFGCPAPTVNRHDGGASLLKSPDRIREIVARVRAAVPATFPVSAKIRLGWSEMGDVDRNADSAIEGGASWLTIHGRTRMQGYSPPAYWGPIGRVARRAPVPVVANGDLWTLDDAKQCVGETGVRHLMLGRGGIADPFLALEVRAWLEGWASVERPSGALDWTEWLERFVALSEAVCSAPHYVVKRVKQWLRHAGERGFFVGFDEIKRMETAAEILAFCRARAAR